MLTVSKGFQMSFTEEDDVDERSVFSGIAGLEVSRFIASGMDADGDD